MSILNRIQKLNRWQRAWLLCSALLLIYMILTFSYKPEYNHASMEFQKLLIEQLDNPRCQDLISKWDKSSSKGRFFADLPEPKMGNDEDIGGIERMFSDYSNPCYGVLSHLYYDQKTPNRAELIKILDMDEHEWTVNFISQLFRWVILIACLYGIGLIGRWIKRGG